jgi:DNA-directed RNA polymerase subunit alpha
MLKYRNFGRKSLDEIKEKIEKVGLGFGMNLTERLVSALEKESTKVRTDSVMEDR